MTSGSNTHISGQFVANEVRVYITGYSPIRQVLKLRE